MGITEGVSVTIAQHNGGTPTFEQLWASDSEGPKLDIYYREGISDLERRLEKWLATSSKQFDLQSIGDDYNLRLDVSQNWPSRLLGLLSNKVQDYLVHTVTAGWLNDFAGLSVKQDYMSMAATDLDDIVYIVGLRDFDFAEAERKGDERKGDEVKGRGMADVEKGQRDLAIETKSRNDDTHKEYISHEVKDRAADGDKKTHRLGNADKRMTEREKNAPQDIKVRSRVDSDANKTMSDYSCTSSERHGIRDSAGNPAGNPAVTMERNVDNSAVNIRPDFADWSGTAPLRPDLVNREKAAWIMRT